MEVTLNIPNPSDWINLEPLLQRLGITVITSKPIEIKPSQSDLDWAIILKGVKKENIEEFVADFEVSRQDRALPFRD
jgi:hypothetical protein